MAAIGLGDDSVEGGVGQSGLMAWISHLILTKRPRSNGLGIKKAEVLYGGERDG